MKATLQLRHAQQLTLTPQLQQSIRLLQLSTQEIHQEISRLLDENPFLEREESDAFEAAPAATPSSSTERESEPDDAQYSSNEPEEESWGAHEPAASSRSDDDNDDFMESAANAPTLREHLNETLRLSMLDTRDQKLIGLLIDALDENGYLSQPLEEIFELLPAELDITLDDLETALVQLQHLDEPGLGARSLSECLSLQLQALPVETEGRNLAIRIAERYLDLLASRDYAKLKKLLHCNDDALRTAQTLITHLNPRPGAEYSTQAADYVVPDVIVDRHKGQWRVRLNQAAMPRLNINQIYANALQRRSEGSQQLSGQLQEARWFIKNLQQRAETILRVSQAIVERQRHFLEHGEIAMRPLVLREIADQLELHESTISRVTTQKYMMTPRGIYELKYFFGSGVSTDSGGACSATAIRALIKQLVGEEDAQQPLTDSRLTEILAQQGIQVARRTVAKYRESLNIPPVNLRKSL
jgi:RNA polymerase sigma-54 factor